MKAVYRPCCGGRTKRSHLGPALAEVGPLPSTNNMVEGEVNSQLGAVLRNRRGADVGQAREGGVPVAPRALGGHEDGGPEWGDRGVREDLHHRGPYPF